MHRLFQVIPFTLVVILSVPSIAQTMSTDAEHQTASPLSGRTVPVNVTANRANSSVRFFLPSSDAVTPDSVATLKEWIPSSDKSITFTLAVPKYLVTSTLGRVDGVTSNSGISETELVQAYADRIGQFLSADDKTRLMFQYTTFFSTRPIGHADDLLRKSAKDLVAFLLAERSLLENYPSAQMLRYGTTIDKASLRTPSDEERSLLESDAYSFLSSVGQSQLGITDEVASGFRSLSGKPLVRVPGVRLGYFVYRTEAQNSAPLPQEVAVQPGYLYPSCDPKKTWQVRHQIGAPVLIKARDEILVAEQPLTSKVWQELPLPTLYRSRVVVVRSYLERSVFDAITYRCDGSLFKTAVVAKKRQIVENWLTLVPDPIESEKTAAANGEELRTLLVAEAEGSDPIAYLDHISVGKAFAPN